MNYWTVLPKQINVQTSSVATTDLPSAPSSSYTATNGAYDENGNLLFYVVDSQIKRNDGSNLVSLNGSGLPMGSEIAIVPKPNSCRNFYIIYTVMYALTGIDLLYTEVDCSGASYSVVGSGTIDNQNNLDGNNAGIAVSKALSDGSRWLFVIAHPTIRKYKITSTGFVTPSNSIVVDYAIMQPGSPNNVVTETLELELYEGTTWKLAWGDPFSNKVYKVDLTAATATYVANSLQTKLVTNATRIYGLEFNNAGNGLYVSGGNGAYSLPLSGAASSLLSNSSNYGHSHIEKAKNNTYYLVSDAGKFGHIVSGIQVSASLAPLSDITVASSSFLLGSKTLNDQIDSDNYNYFWGVPLVSITNFRVNSVNVSAGIPPAPLELYNCGGITLTAAYTGSTSQYKIDLFTTDPANGQQIGCGSCLNYSSGWISSTPPASFNLKNLPGANGTWLQSHTGNYGVRLRVRSKCDNSEVSKLGQIKVNAAPPTAQINLQINNGLTGIPCNVSQNIATPCLTGIYSGSFNLSNSNGTITYYQINSIQEVNCSTGAVIQTVYNGAAVATSGVSGLTAVSLNGLNINGNTGYFANNGLNKCYKITVTVGNVCGSSSSWTYFKCNGSYKTDPLSAAAAQEPDMLLSPNPAHNTVQLSYALAYDDVVSLHLTDLSGKIVATPLPQQMETAGKHQTTLSLTNLPNGTYLYQFTVGAATRTGKLVKISD